MKRVSLALMMAMGFFVFGHNVALAAFDVEAGPIWNQADAEKKCPHVCAARTAKWNGQWRTTVEGAMSVCGCALPCNVEAGPIWNQGDAEKKCPNTCEPNGSWNGQWVTTVWGKMSVCGCKDCSACSVPTKPAPEPAPAPVPLATTTTAKQIQNVGTGKCLDDTDLDQSNGVLIQQYDCRAPNDQYITAQMWNFIPVNGHTQLQNQHSNKCLDVPNLSTANHVKIQQYACHAPNDQYINAQLWDINQVGDVVQIQSVASGKCLDIPDGNPANGVIVEQYDCRPPSDPWFMKAQAWTLNY